MVHIEAYIQGTQSLGSSRRKSLGQQGLMERAEDGPTSEQVRDLTGTISGHDEKSMV